MNFWKQVELCGIATSYELRVGRFDGKFTKVSRQDFLELLNTFMYLPSRATRSPFTTHHASDQRPGKFPGLHSGFLMQNTLALISGTKLNSAAARNFRFVTGSTGTCDGLRKNLGRLVIFP